MKVAERVFLDTNVLLAATDPGRAEHASALRVFNDWPAGGTTLFASGQVLGEYLVVATRPVKANGLGLTRQEALGNVQAFLGRVHLLDEDVETCERLLELMRTVDVSGKQVHDANIVATMQRGGVRALLTRNRDDFERFGHLVELVDFPDTE